MGAGQGNAGTVAVVGIGRHRERTEGLPVPPIGKRNNMGALFEFACHLERCFDSVCPGRTGEHDSVVHVAGSQDFFTKGFQKLFLGVGVEVEAVRDAARLDVFDQLRAHDRVVVPVVERPGTREKVDVFIFVFVVDEFTLRTLEKAREIARIAAHFGFEFFEYFHGMVWLYLRCERSDADEKLAVVLSFGSAEVCRNAEILQLYHRFYRRKPGIAPGRHHCLW